MRLASCVAVFAAASSASWLARAQPPDSQHAPPPPPIYTPPPSYVPAPTYYVVPGAEKPAPGRLAAPRNALELTVGTGYTQGFGNLTRGVGLPSVVSAGVGFDFGVGYRFNEHWAVRWAWQFQDFTAERTDAAGGFMSSVSAQYHFAPTRRVDPWLELGVGYRYLWESLDFGPIVQTHGVQLVHVNVGLDFRPDEQIALGPVIGADATMFRWQDRPGYSIYLADPQVSTFVYAGIQGRFDIGGSTTSTNARYATR